MIPLRPALFAALMGLAGAAPALPGFAAETYRFALAGPPGALDPQMARGRENADLVRLLFEGLYEDDANGRPVAALAAAAEVSEDGLIWRFTLAPAQWSDGAFVRAEDFVAALRRLAMPGLASPNRWLLEDMKLAGAAGVMNATAPPESLGARALDDGRLELRLSAPQPHLRAMLAHHAALPVPSHLLGADGQLPQSGLAGNGAFTLAEAQGAQGALRFEANPRYRNSSATQIAAIEAEFINDVDEALQAFVDGRIDRMTAPPAMFRQLREAFPEAAIATPIACTYGLLVNLGEDAPAALKSPDLRRALSLAIDRVRLTEIVLDSAHRPAIGWTDPLLEGALPDPGAAAPESADAAQDEARAMLAALGYTDEAPLRLRLSHNAGDDHRLIARAVQAMWREVGVIVSISSQDWQGHIDELRAGGFQIARYGWCADYNAPDAFLAYFVPGGPNYGQYESAAFSDALAAMSEGAPDGAARAEAVLRADLPIIPLYHYGRAELVRPGWAGLALENPMQRWHGRQIRHEE
ncbi:MAG: peptide ABC transporter substrate-binding protein [Paracoccus sp. (in: a-proteobacteria)]|nr:peptide ABC transporter substrate-binding protein [Paracoccus sp. (in: a-proteobacteria)]